MINELVGTVLVVSKYEMNFKVVNQKTMHTLILLAGPDCLSHGLPCNL